MGWEVLLIKEKESISLTQIKGRIEAKNLRGQIDMKSYLSFRKKKWVSCDTAQSFKSTTTKIIEEETAKTKWVRSNQPLEGKKSRNERKNKNRNSALTCSI